jgi:hypothetical protein
VGKKTQKNFGFGRKILVFLLINGEKYGIVMIGKKLSNKKGGLSYDLQQEIH